MGENRLRAWVFGWVESADKLKRLYKTEEINGLGEDRYVIVRADIVDHSDYNVIIPVDAEDDAGLEEAVSVITERLEVEVVSTVRVVEEGHVPWPPHAAHGYITEREVEALPIEQIPIKAGRQHASPGSNKWG
jgi:hypothetical protein